MTIACNEWTASATTMSTDLDESGMRARPADPKRDGVRSRYPLALGRYVLSQPIAAGGMATVHLATTRGEGRGLFACKRPHSHLESDVSFTKMLLDEASVSSRVRHPNVVTMYGAEINERGLVLVMDYVEGVSLATLMSESLPGRLPARVIVDVIAGALRGLHAAHEVTGEDGALLGVVHRDVSPQNILVGTDGIARVLDFGVAKASRRLQSTRKGEVKGKLAYMSPEQLMGGRVDRRTDVYAAAIVLWEALTGSPLFHADDEVETLGLLLEGCRTKPSDIDPSLPAALDEVVMRALAPDACDRFPTAAAMADALEASLPGAPDPALAARLVRTLGAATLQEHRRIRLALERHVAETAGPATRPSAPEWAAPTMRSTLDPFGDTAPMPQGTALLPTVRPSALATLRPPAPLPMRPARPARSQARLLANAKLAVNVVMLVLLGFLGTLLLVRGCRRAANAITNHRAATSVETEPAPRPFDPARGSS
ncbi:MAG: serine/threonine protein kinase [Deltaproteobacteria bacterium]|nr:serine/threonine protein kinase [Deltaproteobacteria bacterium]